METSFCVLVAIVLTVGFVVLHGDNKLQPPGQQASYMPGRNYEFPESKGLSAGAGLRQNDFK
jgi:hypothetical protein